MSRTIYIFIIIVVILVVCLAVLSYSYVVTKLKLSDVEYKMHSLSMKLRKCNQTLTYTENTYEKLREKYEKVLSILEIVNNSLLRCNRSSIKLLRILNSTITDLEECRHKYEILFREYRELLAKCNLTEHNYTQPKVSITILFDRQYYYYLIKDIENAKHDILIMMFLMKYDTYNKYSWIDNLVRELVRAHERGVKVLVLLEYRTHFTYLKINLITYRFLKEHGINVKLDYDPSTLHDKIVIIDDKIVYVGSHNWTESALKYNHEITVRIVSPIIAKEVENYFYKLWNSE